MASRLNPYLNFNGDARQAVEFYQGVFGGNLTLSTFADYGMGDSDKVMHAALETDAATRSWLPTPRLAWRAQAITASA